MHKYTKKQTFACEHLLDENIGAYSATDASPLLALVFGDSLR